MKSASILTGRDRILTRSDLENELLTVAREGKEFAGSVCPRIKTPTAAEFLRDYVLPNRPCIITDALTKWGAMSLWTDDYLRQRLGEIPVSVNVTPNGRGDAVLDNTYFVTPEERQMTFSEFLRALHLSREASSSKVAGISGKAALRLDQPDEDDVFYLSHQNDNLRTQLHPLQADVDPTIAFAEAALGAPPDAVNLWVGDARAVTTLHKDHYENMYAVVRGEKRFTLFPPTTLPLLYPRRYAPREYRKLNGRWHILPSAAPGAAAAAAGSDGGDGDSGGSCGGGGGGGGCGGGGAVPAAGDEAGHQWISVDPSAPDFDQFPLYRHAEPMRVAVRRGELLYLPAMWYHQVAQADDTIAVNYWYDMVYDSRFVFNRLLDRLTTRLLEESAAGGGACSDPQLSSTAASAAAAAAAPADSRAGPAAAPAPAGQGST